MLTEARMQVTHLIPKNLIWCAEEKVNTREELLAF